MSSLIKGLIYPLLKKYKGGFVIIFFFSMMVSLSGVLQPFIMQHIIDDAIVSSDTSLLFILVALSFGLTILSMGISALNEIYYTSHSMNVLFEFRKIIFNALFLHNKSFVNRYHSADLMSRVQGDISELQRFFTDSVLAIFSTIMSLIFISFILYSYNIKLMILMIVFLPIEYLCLRPMYPRMHESTKKMREYTSDISKFFIENFRYLLVLKNLGAKESTLKKLDTIQDGYKSVVLQNKKINLLFSQIPAFISLLGKTLIVLYGGYLTIQGELKLGELIAFLTYFGMILAPVHTILGVVNNISKVKVSLQRVTEIMPHAQESKTLNTKNYDLHIGELDFAHDTNELFKNVTLEIKHKSKIALIGKNGIGKSTFGDLLCGLFPPTSGTIHIGGHEIGMCDYLNLSEYIVKLEQAPVIFDDTLRGNLLLAKPGAKDDELISALEKTGLGEWFKTLLNGLDTNILESGNNVSGGQKQRLALSRILLLNPKIIVLDEFTSSIDETDTKWFFENITQLFADSTIIVITHHMQMLEHFETVYVLENKTLKEVDYAG